MIEFDKNANISHSIKKRGNMFTLVTKHELLTTRAIFQPLIFQTMHKVIARARVKGEPLATPSIWL